MMVVALTVATGVMVVVFGSQISCFSEPTNLFFLCGFVLQNLFVVVLPFSNHNSLALEAQMLVQMNRADKASLVLAKMQQMDDDSTLTELVKGWVCTGQGQNKQEQALYAFEELVRSSLGMVFIS